MNTVFHSAFYECVQLVEVFTQDLLILQSNIFIRLNKVHFTGTAIFITYTLLPNQVVISLKYIIIIIATSFKASQVEHHFM